jgi:hypothetical protein
MAINSANTEQAPNPNEKLVRVFDTEQESEAMVVRGLLESDARCYTRRASWRGWDCCLSSRRRCQPSP